MSAARPHSSPLLERVAFKTSRLAEFCGVEELTKRVGHPSDRWPLVILKEGVDNSLDACEEAKIAPEIDITVSADTGEITIIDNGPGIPPETVASIADYTIRTSSWHAYIAPTRGRQGNALQCAAAMPFALDGTQGATVIEARGQRHVIKFMMNRVHRRPDITHQTGDSDVQIGTRTTVRWPRNACPLLKAVKDQFVQLAAAYTTFNPHLTLRCWWDQKEISVAATTPEWHKWRACDPTSAHWYSRDTFERYAAAHVARDQEQGNIGRTVRDFISELRGLRRPDAQKLVLEETGSSRIPLADYFSQGETAIARLLHSCQHHTELVNPKKLGIIGEYHLFQHCVGLGAFAESFSYRKFCGMTDGGLPSVLEVAFGYCPGNTEAQIISGINFSIALGDPFQRLGPYNTLRGILGQQEIDYNDPVVVVLHYVSPVVDFSDHGKTTLTLPPEVGRKAAELIEAATKPWADQKRAERRRESARDNRALKLLKATPKCERRDPAEPTGILAEKISAAADELGVPINSLTVLSPSADPYTA